MTTTPENGASNAADQNPQTFTTQPLPPVGATQPLPVHATQPLPAAPAQPHPTNPFTPPHPAAPADQRAAYEAAQRAAAAQQPVHVDQFEAVRRAQWEAAQRAAAHQPVPVQQPVAAYAGQSAAVPGPVPPGNVPTQRKRNLWLPVTGAAAAAAIVAAVATAGLTHALSDDAASGDRPASLASIGQSSNDAVPVAGSTSDDPDWEAVAKAVQQSVVAIQVSDGNGGGAQGSGVIIDDEGHIVTNNHVVAGADGDVQVTLTDGRLFEASIVGLDPTTDLAVIKLKDVPDDLKASALGDSSKVIVGQPVMAVGNPLGLANTVTTGIVSAIDRPVSTAGDGGGEGTVTNAIQIDAAVNPGNSGGPLFDASGKVIGINSSIATLSSESGSIGLGFAIPVDLVKNIAAQLVEDGTAEHAFLGVGLSDGTATADGVTRRGAVVESVSEGSPAAKAELQVEDTIVAIDGKAVGGAESLTAYVRALASGADSTLTVVRDGKTIEVDVTLAVRPENVQQEQPQQEPGQQAPDEQQGGSGIPDGLSPEQLWEWFQQQGGQG
ncbi:S1C family serine protease [Cellulomonas sp. Leaf334]|uniref:S1C family serine protease n=1 Tax=Cellulomonas sp. Leaf334 TaxID=1736339 RepID=UPI0006FB2485|nr:trypsin-like peptidase domain-containing protein [Cellulomonas sp. Leaf334]KQR17042.1 peptidase S1 [Cellulomonas sp. Leaf334]